MAEGMLPPEISSVVIPSIKYEVVVPEPGYLAFALSTDFPFVTDTIGQYIEILDKHLPADLGVTFEVEGSAPYNSKDMLAQKD